MQSGSNSNRNGLLLDDNIALRYYRNMIKSFANKSTQRIWEGQQVKGFSVEVQTVALRKMQMIHAATRLESLRIPPGNRLKPLQGKRSGEHSIRVNDQFRICFKWDEGNALDVVLEDYH